MSHAKKAVRGTSNCAYSFVNKYYGSEGVFRLFRLFYQQFKCKNTQFTVTCITKRAVNGKKKKPFFCMKNNSCSKYSYIDNFVLILLME